MEKLFAAIDIGNTQISFGFFSKDKIVHRFDYPTHQERTTLKANIQNDLKKLKLAKEGVSAGLMGSVVPSISNFIKEVVEEIFAVNIEILENKINLEVKMDIDNPLELGADLLADIIATKHLYQTPAIIVDLGTVSKYITIAEDGTFIGTSFYPGLKGSLEAMGQNTALLPNLDTVQKFPHPYGKNTVDSMLSGIYFGTISSVRGISDILNQEFDGKATRVLTGGYSNIIYEQFGDFIFDKDLTLKGLYLLHKGDR